MFYVRSSLTPRQSLSFMNKQYCHVACSNLTLVASLSHILYRDDVRAFALQFRSISFEASVETRYSRLFRLRDT
jgi:hypothetical protein